MQLRSGRTISSDLVELSIQTELDFSQYDHPISPVMDSPSSHALLRPCVTPPLPPSSSELDNIYYTPVYDSNPRTPRTPITPDAPRTPTLSPIRQTSQEINELKIMDFTSQLNQAINNINDNDDKKKQIRHAIHLFKIILQNRELFHLPKMTPLKKLIYPKYIDYKTEFGDIDFWKIHCLFCGP